MDKPFVIVCGLGYFETKLLEEISKAYFIVAIDVNPQKIENLREKFPNVIFVNADASSILTWKKLDLKNLTAIITTFVDSDVSLEVCRIARLSYNLDVPIIVVSYSTDHSKEFENFNAKIVKPIETAIDIVLGKLLRNFSKAVNIGLGQSEIIEVSVLSKSHLTDKKLSTIKAKSWRVAAIYRNNQLIIPDGDSIIKVNDKVILVGSPKTLENVANIFLKGIPQFPIQYGTECVVVENPQHSIINEAIFLAQKLILQKMTLVSYKFPLVSRVNHEKIYHSETIINNINEIFNKQEDIGLFIIPEFRSFFSLTLKTIFKSAQKPFLIAKASQYDGVLAILNSYDMLGVLESAIELSKIFSVPFRVLLNVMPDNLSTLSEKLQIKKANTLIRDFESVYKFKINFKIVVANPIIGTLKYASQFSNHLVVINYKRGSKISFFKPHIAYLIAKKIKNSIVVIPNE